MKRPKLVFLFILAALLVSTGLIAIKVYAATDYLQIHKFYWSGTYTEGGGQDQFVPCGSDPKPFVSSDANKTAFVAKLKKYLNGCAGLSNKDNERNKIGAETIISILTDAGWGNKGSITDLENLLGSSDISIKWELKDNDLGGGYCPNMASKLNDSGKYDDFYGLDCVGATNSIVIYSGTKEIMAIRSACGNIWGKPLPLPKSWDVTPTTTVDSPTKKPGQTATWTHTTTITGTATKDITRSAIHSNGWSGSISFSTLQQPKSGSFANTETKTFTNADINKTFCSALRIDPTSSTSNSSQTATPACVTVTSTPPPPVNDPCRPVKKTITAQTYPAQNNGHVSTPAFTPSYKASTDKYSDPTVFTGTNTWNTVDLTRLNTDGNTHAITLTDTRNHVSYLETVTHVYYIGINKYTRYWIPDQSYEYCAEWTYDSAKNTWTCARTATGIIPAHWSPWSYAGQYQSIGRYAEQGGIPGLPGGNDTTYYSYNTRTDYWYTIVHYSDGDTKQLVSGSAPSNTTNNGASRTAASSPIGPCFDYMLSAGGSSIGTLLEPGATASVGPYSINNNSSWTQKFNPSFWSVYKTQSKSKSTYWQITQLIIDPGKPIPEKGVGQDSTADPCLYYDPTNISLGKCSVYQSGNSTVPIGSLSINANSFTIPDVKAGTKICYGFSIRPDRSDPSNTTATPDYLYWYHIPLNKTSSCILVVKKPKVQVWGGDLNVGKVLANSSAVSSRIDTSQSVKSGRTYGSWGEYGIFASGSISGMGSGSTLAPQAGLGRLGSNSCNIAQLTFSNSIKSSTSWPCNGSTFGIYNFGANLRDISGYFTSTTAPASTINPTTLASGTYASKTLSSLTITGGLVNGSIILNVPNATVTIGGNITYRPGTSTLTTMPQLVIIAKNIYINENVTRVDAWLAAPTGTISTCNGKETAQLTIYDCSGRLDINGPVTANKLYLRRTAGSNPATESGDPAEVINLRSDAYLWMYNMSKKDNRLRTTYVVEMPPKL